MDDLQRQMAEAVRFFWDTRSRQQLKQETSGRQDQGSRGAVTGGSQLDGFIGLVSEILVKCGIPQRTIFRKKRVDLPGYFRPTKEWDLLVVVDGELLASIEFKSQVGPSFGNNFNNRTEEAMGTATDLWTAYREGAFKESTRPWLGYFMLLEEAPGSVSPVKCSESHFPVFPEFRGASYAQRYEIFCRKLMRERLYDASCLILSERATGIQGQYREPARDLDFAAFLASLTAKAGGYLKFRRK